MITRAFIGLGANLGDRLASLKKAVERLSSEGIEVKAISSLYETAPVGMKPETPAFLNAVVEVATVLTARLLLARLLEIEAKLGRRRPEPDRPIDLDILLYGDATLAEPDLVVPHPRLGQRAFALAPLAELAPGLRLPWGETVAEAAARTLAEGQKLRVFQGQRWWQEE